MVAITVFFALVLAFCVFLVPFVGSMIVEIVVLAVYTPTVVAVLVLYAWCVAVNPADAGVLHSKTYDALSCANNKPASSMTCSNVDDLPVISGPLVDRSPISILPEADAARAKKSSRQKDERLACFSQCCTQKSHSELPLPAASMLYCSLCKVEISKHSRHCRICDKCVDGFDHHCQWLNNCIGKKNYNAFFALMACTVVMLILHWSVGLWLLVHGFMNVSQFESVIALKLGSSFSFFAYITVVILCTLLAMGATYPLSYLFVFHILLIKKGISTYDYVIAMRELEQLAGIQSAHDSHASAISSSRTALSGGSSQGQAWCTPPQIVFDHEQSVFPLERSLSVKDIESVLRSSEENLKRKTPVKLNPWALASLNKDDVLRSTTSAVNRSSILQPVVPINEKTLVEMTDSSVDSTRDANAGLIPFEAIECATKKLAEVDVDSSDRSVTVNMLHSEAPLGFLKQSDGNGTDSGDVHKLSEKGKRTLNSLQIEARNTFKISRGLLTGRISVSSSESSDTSLGGQHFRLGQRDMLDLPRSLTAWRWRQNPEYDAQGGESAEDNDGAKSLPCTPSKHKTLSTSHRRSM